MNCGTCGVQVPLGGACQNGTPMCAEGATVCGATCSMVTADPTNCGMCGRKCPVAGSCVDGTCYYPISDMTIESCKAACAATGGKCDPGGRPEYGNHPALIAYDGNCQVQGQRFFLPRCTDVPPDAVSQPNDPCTGNFQTLFCACTQ